MWVGGMRNCQGIINLMELGDIFIWPLSGNGVGEPFTGQNKLTKLSISFFYKKLQSKAESPQHRDI